MANHWFIVRMALQNMQYVIFMYDISRVTVIVEIFCLRDIGRRCISITKGVS